MVIALIVFFVLIIVFLLYGYKSNYFLTREYYDIYGFNLNNNKSIKCVMLADLHEICHGNNNSNLIAMVRDEKPDIIFIAGDMLVKNGKGEEECLTLCKDLQKIANVYYAPGNHEVKLQLNEDIYSKIRGTGVSFLSNEYAKIDVNGDQLTVYGLDIPIEHYLKCWKKKTLTTSDIIGLFSLNESNDISKEIGILIAHNPEYFDLYEKFGAKLVLSGHNHGGIMRLPILGGVLAPSLRVFPKYDSGLFGQGNTKMVLSRGLGTHHIKFRFFNNPELSIINLHGEERK